MRDIAESLHGVASETGFSGVVRVDRGVSTQSVAYGLAHRGFRIRNTVDTQFAIASGGKGRPRLAADRGRRRGVVYSSHDPATRSTWTVVSNTTDGAWPIVRHLVRL